MPTVIHAQILETAPLTATARDIRLNAPGIACEAKPGQFVHIKCGDALLRRPISICGIEGEDMRIVVDDRGAGTAWLCARSKGETLDVLGPLGRGFTIIPGERVLLAGGGIGAPPLLYAASACECPDAVLGFRNAHAVMLEDDFGKFCGRVGVCTDDGSYGAHCLADSLVSAALERGSYARILACGPHPMLESIAPIARKAGIPCEVSLEQRMGCGVGACLVCACKATGADGQGKMSHVCADGPVYNAEEVMWI